MSSTRLQVVIPFHQSISADSETIAHAVSTCYEPILRAIEESAGVRVAVHFSGHLLDHLSRRGEDFLLRLKSLERDGRVEVLGGLFYGSIPALLSESDVRAQVQMTAEYWESFIGHAPTGFWLPELAWTAELPRMLDETGLSYGFISAGQIAIEPTSAHGVATIERGGARVSAFVLSDVLSKALVNGDARGWVDGAIDNTQRSAHAVHTVWMRAETLGLEGGSRDSASFLADWFAGISGGRSEIRTVLPSETFASARPARPAKLLHRCADVTLGEHRTEAVDWPDFALQHAEVDALHRRVMRGSDKLREAIATMEEEGMEEDWSSDLATAQRLIFAAQAPDPYWNGRVAGFKDPRVRDAAVARLTKAERLIDGLVQGEDDWIGAEEEDRDGDLVDEVIVSSRHLSAWVVPADGARIRTLDDRESGRNVLDAVLPGSAKLTAQGLRDIVLDLGTSSSELANARELTQNVSWEQKASGIDEEGDLTYSLEISASHALNGHGAQTLNVDKLLTIACDKPELSVTTKARAVGGRGVLLATQIPVRLGAQQATLTVNGNEARVGEHDNVEEVVVSAEDGSAVTVRLSEPREVWISQAVRDDASAGLVITQVVNVETEAETTLTLTLTPAPRLEDEYVGGDEEDLEPGDAELADDEEEEA